MCITLDIKGSGTLIFHTQKCDRSFKPVEKKVLKLFKPFGPLGYFHVLKLFKPFGPLGYFQVLKLF